MQVFDDLMGKSTRDQITTLGEKHQELLVYYGRCLRSLRSEVDAMAAFAKDEQPNGSGFSARARTFEGKLKQVHEQVRELQSARAATNSSLLALHGMAEKYATEARDANSARQRELRQVDARVAALRSELERLGSLIEQFEETIDRRFRDSDSRLAEVRREVGSVRGEHGALACEVKILRTTHDGLARRLVRMQWIGATVTAIAAGGGLLWWMR